MSAGKLDLFIETGAAWERKVEVFSPGTPVEAQAMTTGRRYYVDGVPTRVAEVADVGNGTVRVTLGEGVHGDPVLTLPAAALIIPADPVTIDEAAAAFITEPVVNPLAPVTVPIPTTIAGDGLSVTMSYTADETSVLVVDAGAHSWDLYLRTTLWDWRRVLEGTLTVVKGDAR